MPFNSKRNSRDDNSGKSRRSTSDSTHSRRRTDSRQDHPYGSRPSSTNKSSRYSKSSDKPFNSDRPARQDVFREQDDKQHRKGSRPFSKDEKPYRKDDRPYSKEGKPYRKDAGTYSKSAKPFRKDKTSFPKDGRPFRKDSSSFGKEGNKPYSGDKFERKDRPGKDSFQKGRRRNDKSRSESQHFSTEPENDGLIRLNRYIANSGVCSRRKADELIQAGVVSVNGEVITELGSKVDPSKDEIRYNGERLKREKMIYVLLNKPKDYITTTDDPQERRTVMHLVSKATKERIYPVGRLDRNTTGLLLMTNDGNLAEKLSHPRNNISKIYHIELDKNLSQGDFNKLAFGLELEDGFVKPDDISYVQGASKCEVGIQIHSGKNRIVRRIFEHLGYEVIKLDRVVYANLTKKDLPRGHWRYLTEKEIIQLKHFIK